MPTERKISQIAWSFVY